MVCPCCRRCTASESAVDTGMHAGDIEAWHRALNLNLCVVAHSWPVCTCTPADPAASADTRPWCSRTPSCPACRRGRRACAPALSGRCASGTLTAGICLHSGAASSTSRQSPASSRCPARRSMQVRALLGLAVTALGAVPCQAAAAAQVCAAAADASRSELAAAETCMFCAATKWGLRGYSLSCYNVCPALCAAAGRSSTAACHGHAVGKLAAAAEPVRVW